MAITTLSSRQVLVSSIDIPDVKEVGGWLAGGIFRNESYPGGVNYSPVGTPSFTNTMQSPGYAPNFLNGNFDYLNSGLSNMFSFINYGYYDLLTKTRKKDVTVLEYTIIIESAESSEISSSDKESVVVGEINGKIYGIAEGLELVEIQRIDRGYTNILGSLLDRDAIKVISTIGSLSTGDSMTMEQRFKSEIVGFAKNQLIQGVTNQFVSSIAKTAQSAMVLGGLIGALLNEAWEMSVGLDVYFGLGGEFVAYDPVTGEAYYTAPGAFELFGYNFGADGYVAKDLQEYEPNYGAMTESLYLDLMYDRVIEAEVDYWSEVDAYGGESDYNLATKYGFTADEWDEITNMGQSMTVADLYHKGGIQAIHDYYQSEQYKEHQAQQAEDERETQSYIDTAVSDWGTDDGGWF